MTETKAVAQTVTMPAWAIHLNPTDHPRPWRLAVSSSSFTDPEALQRAAFHLTEADVAILAATLLYPPRPQDRPPGRAVLIRDGFGLRLRLFVDSVDGDRPEPRGLIHLQEHHRQVLVDDIGRHRPDLIPTGAPPEPRLCLDPMPVTGLTIDQVAELHSRLGWWLDSEGVRAAVCDRAILRRVLAPEGGR
ncbi:hypothetical protein [Embleya sp. AB8]|uniref:hypothetical protein n=1 Tax=Embleya sp. AB8 TaxID=3156304 RepID=UPI003C73B091